MWKQAKKVASMLEATMTGLSVIHSLSKSSRAQAPEALRLISQCVVALIEGYRGKIDGREVNDLLLCLEMWIKSNSINEELIERFMNEFSAVRGS
jgi:hypothetical protein